MKKLAIGHISCHVCDLDADVKISEKSGLAFTFCSDCNVQSFCRNQSQHDKLISRMRPVTVSATITDNVEKTAQPPVTVTEKKSGFSLGNL